MGGSVAEWLVCLTQVQKARVQIAAAMLSDNSLRQTVHTHRASVHQAAKLVAVLLRVAGVTAGLVESNAGFITHVTHAGRLPRTGISSGTLRSVIEYRLPLPFLHVNMTVTGVRARENWVVRSSFQRRAVAVRPPCHQTTTCPDRWWRPSTKPMTSWPREFPCGDYVLS